eukprot:gene22327-30572_t
MPESSKSVIKETVTPLDLAELFVSNIWLQRGAGGGGGGGGSGGASGGGGRYYFNGGESQVAVAVVDLQELL